MRREDRNKPSHTDDTCGVATGIIEARYNVLHVDSLTWRASHLLPQRIGHSVANSTNSWTSHTCRPLHLAFVACNDSIKELASIILLLPFPMNIIIHHRFRPIQAHPSLQQKLNAWVATEYNAPRPTPLLARWMSFVGTDGTGKLGSLGCLRSRKSTEREPLPRDFRTNCATISGGLAVHSPRGIPAISSPMVSRGACAWV